MAKDAAAAKTPSDCESGKQCYNCGKMGHMQPDCPSKKAGEPKGKGPYLSVDVSSSGEGSDRILHMMAHLDSGAELDGVG